MTRFFLLLLALVTLSACASRRSGPLSINEVAYDPISDDPRYRHPSSPVRTPERAIAIVRVEIKRRGQDPSASEYQATRNGKNWHVTAWHIRYPQNKGSSRFVPGGHTSYTVNIDGRITAIHLGR